MTKLIVNTIDSRSTSTEFKDVITANHKKQWLDKTIINVSEMVVTLIKNQNNFCDKNL